MAQTQTLARMPDENGMNLARISFLCRTMPGKNGMNLG